jgi:hypothetical protein
VEAILGKIADATIEDFYDISESGHPQLNLQKAKERGVLKCIKGFTYDDDNKPIPIFKDDVKAIEILARRHGLLDTTVNLKANIAINEVAVRATVAKAMEDEGRLLAMIDLAEQLAGIRGVGGAAIGAQGAAQPCGAIAGGVVDVVAG